MGRNVSLGVIHHASSGVKVHDASITVAVEVTVHLQMRSL